MMGKMCLIFLLLGAVASQDAVSVRVFGSASSENVVQTGDAVAEAIAKIDKACEKGDKIDIIARSEAKKVVEAAASAVAQGGIVIESRGNGEGSGSTAASATSNATAIAKAIANAIGNVAGGPQVKAATDSITQATESVTVAIEQQAALKGQGNALAIAAASATAFVSAVADALAIAAAKCAGKIGTVDAGVNTQTTETPSFADFTSTFTAADANIQGPGIATIVKNLAEAKADGNTLTPLSTPLPASSYKPAAAFQNDILRELGLL
eukprot:TRINITY_DN5221_c0_g1_i6.p1 TRINITY_DN5221_c0_g1~~TRINITY_DN5221_c0_g1_i6.p1  ORF type:complete len:267 (+),score=90.24 TRINITY_DN5221_c0_g1_i6:968-1768(+)